MSFWSLFFGKNEVVKPALPMDQLPAPFESNTAPIDKYNHLDLTSSEPIKIELPNTPPPLPKMEVAKETVIDVKKEETKIIVETPKQLYPFTEKWSYPNMANLVKYWYDNIDKWGKDYDRITYGKIKNSVSSMKSHVGYKNDQNYEFSFFPDNCSHWFRIVSDGRERLKCSLEYYSTSHFGRREEYVQLEYKRYDTTEKIYNFLYDLTTKMELSASDEFKFANYCERNKLLLKSDRYKFFKINGGEYYICPERIKHSERYREMHGITSTHYNRLRFYKFSDWTPVSQDYQSFVKHFGENPTIEECEDPKQEFWQHFTKLEIEKKINFMNECKEFVKKVYVDEVEYNALMKEAELENPFPKVVCYSTMTTFCKNINKTIPYTEHDINSAIAKLKEEREKEISAKMDEVKENFNG